MKKVIYLFPFFLLLSSCKMGYIPTVINSPMFEEKNQLSLSASVMTNVDFQAAFSISDNIYLHGDASLLVPGEEGESGFSYSGGVGFYKQYENRGIFELALGAGVGTTEETYNKFYIQPTFGKKNLRSEIGFSPRLVLVNYPLLTSTSNTGTTSYSATDFFFEPVGIFRFGQGRTKFQVQLGFSLPANYNSQVAFIPVIWGVGAHFRL